MSLDIQIRDLTESWGVDYFGVADLFPARDFIFAQGGPAIAEYPRAVSIGIALPHSVVNQLPQRMEHAVAVSYRHHAYDVINQRLDLVASQLSSVLGRKGYRVLPIAASKQVDDERICASFSHKLGAHLAGLGWIGKSCLLITPERGPRVRWATVLTDAPLRATGQPIAQRCGTCTQCVDICPVDAFTGRPFQEDEPREARYDAGKCDRYFDHMVENGVEPAVCGLCLYICPYGRQESVSPVPGGD